MTNIQIVEIETIDGKSEHVIIDRGNGEFTSMPKSVWDELEAAKEAQSL
jgi:acyl-CoA thioesterase FadM